MPRNIKYIDSVSHNHLNYSRQKKILKLFLYGCMNSPFLYLILFFFGFY